MRGIVDVRVPCSAPVFRAELLRFDLLPGEGYPETALELGPGELADGYRSVAHGRVSCGGAHATRYCRWERKINGA